MWGLMGSITFKFLINMVSSSVLVPLQLRGVIYRSVGMKMHGSVASGCYFRSNKIDIGERTWINYKCIFDNAQASITIGNSVAIGPQVMFCTSSHGIGGPEHRASGPINLPITVGDAVWIGTRATILPGVSIGHGCVIAAGSVVIKDCEPDGLYAGVPARRIRDLPI